MLDHDQQILESVSVRRDRLLRALLFAHQRTRRKYDDGLKFLLISAVIAAIICAGCIGFSFIINLFSEQQDRTGPAVNAHETSLAVITADQSEATHS